MPYSISSLSLFLLLLSILSGCGLGGGNTQTEEELIDQTLFSKVEFTSDETCPNGGVRVSAGIDENDNGLLDEDEVDVTETICNGLDGVAGSAGPAGPQGPQGSEGQPGAAGEDGIDSLIITSDESIGANCSFGGLRLDAGQDLNRNGVLDQTEIQATSYLCKQYSDAFSGLVFIEDPDATSNLTWTQLKAYEPVSGANTILAAPSTATGEIENFQISPDKTKIAFLMKEVSDKPRKLYVVDSTINNAPVLLSMGDFVTNSGVKSFKWSNDSNYVAYISDREVFGRNDLFLVRSDATKHKKLSQSLTGLNDVVDYGFSSDSKYLYFIGETDIADDFDLRTHNIDKSIDVLISTDKIKVTQAEFSPDNSRIGYIASNAGDGSQALYTIRPDGTQSSEVKVSDDFVDPNTIDSFSWSPLSNRIAFIADAGYGSELFVTPPTANNTELFSPRDFVNYNEEDVKVSFFKFHKWSPDGNYMAINYNKTFAPQNLHQRNMRVANPLDSAEFVEYVGWQSIDRLEDISWSHDSERVAFSEVKDDDSSSIIYMWSENGANYRLAETEGDDISRIALKWSANDQQLAFLEKSNQLIEFQGDRPFLYETKEYQFYTLRVFNTTDKSYITINAPSTSGGIGRDFSTQVNIESAPLYQWNETGDYLAYRTWHPTNHTDDTLGVYQLHISSNNASINMTIGTAELPEYNYFQDYSAGPGKYSWK